MIVLTTETKKINYKSDFDFIAKLTATNANGESVEVGFPDYDFELIITSGCNGYSTRSFVASSIGGVTKNCFNDNGQLHIVCDSHKLNVGELFGEFKAYLPNGIYPDGSQLNVAPLSFGIELVTDGGDVLSPIEVEIILPYIYDSVYSLAVQGGYEGTQEDYYKLAMQLPNAVEVANEVSKKTEIISESADKVQASATIIVEGATAIKTNADTLTSTANVIEQSAVKVEQTIEPLSTSASSLENSATSIDANTNALTSLVSDWADGKAKIADALTRKYSPTEATESFDAMAKKVMDLPLAVEGQEGIIDHTANGIIDGYDLLNELHKNQRQDYPYCCGVEFASGRHTQVVLSGAEAYLCSDGFFTTEQEVEHTFDEDYKLSHYVIYYYTYPTYQVPTAINPAMKLIAYNGQPRFILSNYYCTVVRSYTNERYSVGSAEVSINYNGHIADIMLSGIEDFGGTVYGGANNTALTTLSLPHVISSTGSISTANTLFSVSLPKLTTINGGNLFTQVNSLRSLSLPSLEVVNGGGITYTTSALTSLSVPKLKIFKGAWLAYGNSKLTDISFPNLEDCQVLNGLLQYFPPEIHFPKLKRCKNIVSQGNRIGGAGIVDVYLPVVEDTCTHGSITAADVYMIFHLGKQQDKTISWTGESRTRVSAFTVENGFRSNLNISPYTHLDVSVIEAIIDNLADNNDYEPLTLTLGATLKNKLSEEYIAIATAKNYNIA